ENMPATIQQAVDKYSFRNSNGDLVLCWDLAKYVNHSFNSNCISTAYDFELAVRDIHPGEQLTDDYGYLNISEPFKAQDEGTERDTVYPDDLLNYHQEWDSKLSEAFEFFEEVKQPLALLIPSATMEKIRKKLQENLPLDSILSLYYRENN
ncbi:SET domain-containing protein-lysine N-methyltransferase, partial [Longispora fulva]|uniref:SET domain-containing protein-lysine N-methyltransferase n=2 Tax=Bacteria TaxID=2 RepID=UPI0036317B88